MKHTVVDGVDQSMTIEDDDGFATTWPWPKGGTMIHNAEFADMFVRLHEQARLDAGLGECP